MYSFFTPSIGQILYEFQSGCLSLGGETWCAFSSYLINRGFVVLMTIVVGFGSKLLNRLEFMFILVFEEFKFCFSFLI